MAARLAVVAVVAALAGVMNAQTAPQRVNATARDGSIFVEWSIPAADNNLKHFEVSAVVSSGGVVVPSVTYLLQDEFTSLSSAWTLDVGKCDQQGYGTWCVNGAMKPANTFSVANGNARILATNYHSFTYSWSYPSSTNGYTRNGHPMMMRDDIWVNSSAVYMTSVMNPDISSNIWGGWMFGGLVVYDRVAGIIRPIIYYWYEIYQNDYSWNEIAIRWYQNTGYHTTFYTNVYPGRGPVELAIHRDAAAGKWSFSYKHATWSAGAWTYMSKTLMDTELVTLNTAGLANAHVGLFTSNEAGTNTTWTFDYFRVATLDSWTAALDATLAVSAPNRTAALIPKGYCGLDRDVVRSGLFYTTARTYYSYIISGLVNGVGYAVTVTSVSQTNSKASTAVVGERKPLPILPTLSANAQAAGAAPALFLDSKSLFPAGNVYRWRDVSGNGRDFIQFTTTRQPASTRGGVVFPNQFAELVQEKDDPDLDLANAVGGMTWFTAYRMDQNGYYYQHQSLLSRIQYNPSDIQYTWTPTLSSDDTGWDIYAFQTGYSPPWTYIHRTGMRITAARNAGSTNSLPSVNGAGARFHWGPQYTMIGHPDTAAPALYTYNYYQLGNVYTVGAAVYQPGKWLLEACRGINTGGVSDLCSIPDIENGITQATTNVPRWLEGFEYLGGTPMWPTGAGTPRWYDSLGASAAHSTSRTKRMRLSDATDYNYYYGRRYFFGTVYGVLIFKNAVTPRADRELLQGWLGERYGLACPSIQYDNVQTSGVAACSPGRFVDANGVCTHTCVNNRRLIGGVRGGEALSCTGGSFLSKGAVCGGQCATLTMPTNAANCTLRYISDSFTSFAGRKLRDVVNYDVYPRYALAVSDEMWTFTDGVVRGNAPANLDECSEFSMRPSILTLNRPLWADATFKYVDPMTWSVKMTLEEMLTEAGIAFRVATTYVSATPPRHSVSYYRIVLTAGKQGGARFELVTGTTDPATLVTTTTVTTLGSTLATTFTPMPWVTYTMRVQTRGANIRVWANNILLFDSSDSAIPHGSVGMYVGAGTASFDDLTVEGPCAVSGNCQANEGGACVYQCPEGFSPQGDGVQACATDPATGQSRYNGTAFTCKPTPPQTNNRNPTFQMFEDAELDSVVGFLNVSAGAANQVLLYTIVSGNNITNNDAAGRPIPGSFAFDIFDIGACTGILTLGSAGVVSYDRGHRFIDLIVRIAVATDLDVFTDIAVRVQVLNARSPPYFAESGVTVKDVVRTVYENQALNAFIGQAVSAVAPEPGQVVLYDILYGNAGGEFAINNRTGQLSVRNVAAFNFEGAKATPAVPTEYFLIVRAQDQAFPKLQSTVNVRVIVADLDDAPFVPRQDLFIIEDTFELFDKSIGSVTGWKDEDELDVTSFSLTGVTTTWGRPPVASYTSPVTLSNFFINATTGEVKLMSPVNLGAKDNRPFLIIDGKAVRDVFVLKAQVRDTKTVEISPGVFQGPFTVNFDINVYVMVNNSYGGNGVVMNAVVTRPDNAEVVPAMDTAGGEKLVITGRDFGVVFLNTGDRTNVWVNLTASAGPGSPARTYMLNGCRVETDDATITCNTVPGYGKDLALVVYWGTKPTVMVFDSGSPLLLSYNTPVVRAVTVWNNIQQPPAGYTDPLYPNPPNTNEYATQGGHGMAITVENTGPVGNNQIVVTYGPINGFEYTAGFFTTDPMVSSGRYGAGTIRARLAAGVGNTLYVRVRIGNLVSELVTTVFVGYGAPKISSVAPLPGSNFTLSTLRPLQLAQPQQVEIVGSNFGGPLGPNIPFGVRFVSSRTFEVDGISQTVPLVLIPSCRKPNTAANAEHMYVVCDVPSGFGFGYKVQLTVAGQTNTVLGAAFDMSYDRPNITDISGNGVSKADTSGGQEVILTGTNFGPATLPGVDGLPPVRNPVSVTYGGPTRNKYVAQNCRVVQQVVTLPQQLACQLAPGSGAGHQWRAVIAGLAPVSQPAFTTSYGQPVIVSLSRSSTPNDNRGFVTPGGETVYVTGKNFGPLSSFNDGLYSINYTLTLESPVNALNGTLGLDSNLQKVYTPACTMTVPHFEIACVTVEGAGTELSWSMMIDGLRSTEPLLGYRKPVIEDITNVDGTALGELNTDGGETIRIVGLNFGPQTYDGKGCDPVSGWPEVTGDACTGLVQAIKYGPTGREYDFAQIHVVSDTEILARTQPGFGGPHFLELTIADQLSPRSVKSFTYKMPVIKALAPANGPAQPDTNSYEVTVTGENLGLKNPYSEVSILVGNPGDRSVSKLIRTHYSSIEANGDHTVKFFLPPGLLTDRAVRAVVHPRGQPESMLRVETDPIVDGSVANFHYDTPQIDNAVLTVVPANDRVVVNWLVLTANIPLADHARTFQLVILGKNFGPDRSATMDNVLRKVVYTADSSRGFDMGSAVIYSWSDTRIVAFTQDIKGIISVQHEGVDFAGSAVTVTSNSQEYLNLSPEIRAILGPTSVATQGGDSMTLTVGYLSSTVSSLSVKVGGTPARLFTTDGRPVDSFADFKTYVIDPARIAAADPAAANATFVFVVPPGEGRGVPVVVQRDTDVSDVTATINYKAPVIHSYSLWNHFSLSWETPVQVTSSSVIQVPTLGTKLRLFGDNFGLCPKVTMGLTVGHRLNGAILNDDQGALFKGGATCNGEAVPAGEPLNNHTFLVFEAAPGQGTGEDLEATNGFIFVLDVRGQVTPSIKYRYTPPTLTMVTPMGRTEGGDTITVKGRNLGYTPALGLTIKIGQSLCSGVQYTPTMPKSAEQTLTCTLPEGSGGPHPVTVSHTPYVCTLARCTDSNDAWKFTYYSPIIQQVWFNGTGPASSLYTSVVLNGTNTTLPYTDATVFNAYLQHMTHAGTELLVATRHGQDGPVRMPTAGGYVVTLYGDNFGSFDLSKHCLFTPWAGRDIAQPLRCDNQVSFLGENEVPRFAILHWSHTRITFVMPPGYGARELQPVVAGQESAHPVAMHYSTPVITTSLSPAKGDTEGGTKITVRGANFGMAPIDTSKPTLRARASSGPLPLTLEEYLTQPTGPQAVMLVNFFRKCVSSHLDVAGNKVEERKRCDAGVLKHTDDEIVFLSAPGIGVNRSVTVEVFDVNRTHFRREWEGSANYSVPIPINYTSNSALFTYNLPEVTLVEPAPLLMDGTNDKVLTLVGHNFGRPPADLNADGTPNVEAWTAEEKAVSVTVANLVCDSAERFERRGAQVVQCRVDDTTVGYKNLSYSVASQANYNEPIRGAFMACKVGYFGRPGEHCLPCPEGAFCMGFDVDLIEPAVSLPDGTTNETAGPSQSEIDGGTHTYPRPLPTFYNMNSSDMLTKGMLATCPEQMRIEGRDVCIVGCEPAEACLGDNHCAEAYISKAPYFRCSSCAPGFYKRANECVKCPNSPYALVIGFVLLVLAAAAAAYVLNKKKINIAFIAIFVDWAQVIAIFASSKVAWPPVVKELFHILSAFNLNIEIVAPECIVPDLQYKQKWTFIMVLPIALTGFFALITAVQLGYRKYIKGRKVSLVNQGVSFMSMVLLLMYVLYIYLTRNILDVFNCQPTEPPDGKFYLTAVFEECGIAGGTQMTLISAAVAAAAFYIAGYPLFVFNLLYRNKEAAMEDQLLRAKGVGNDKLSNPRAYFLRKQFSRVYYQFKPDCIFWVLAILLRKFCLAATYILFNRNANFQLAAALLVLFVAYAAQMKYSPYMGPGDFEDVIKNMEMRAIGGDAVAAKLYDRVKAVEARGRKKVHKNLMSASGKIDASALLGLLRGWLFAYNTVEEIMIFSAGTVALMGIMYASLNSNSTFFQNARDSVTWVIVGAIILTIIYFVTVVCTEVYILYTEDQRRKVMERRAKQKGKGKLGEDDKEAVVAAQLQAGADVAIGAVSTAFNPMFDGAQSTSGLREVVASTDDVPSVDLWRVFRQGYQELQDELDKLSKEAAEVKAAQQKMEAAANLLEQTTGQKITLPEVTDANGEKFRAGRRKNEFGPVGSGDGATSPSFGGSSPISPMARKSPSFGGAQGKSLRSLASMQRK